MKKGAVQLLLIIFGVLIGISLVLISAAPDKADTKYIGQAQKFLLEGGQEAENVLFYLDQTARLDSVKGMSKLSLKGGFLEPKCGEYQGYTLWGACFPDDVKFALAQEVRPLLAQSMKNYPLSGPVDFDTQVLYDKSGLNLVAKSKDDLRIALGAPFKRSQYITGDASLQTASDVLDREISGIYSIGMNTKVKIFDIVETYDELKKKSSALLSACSSEDCVKRKRSEYGWSDGCKIDKKEVFDEFIEYLELCSGSLDDDCVCKFLPPRKDLLFSDDIVVSSGYSIGEWTLKYDDKTMKLRQKYENVKNGDFVFDYDGIYNGAKMGEVSLGQVIYIHKNDGVLSLLSDGERISKSTCNLNQKEFKMCSTDPVGNLHRFALKLQDLPPPPVEKVVVSDFKIAENSVLLTFEEVDASDIKEYVIYYSTEALGSLSDIKKGIEDGVVFEKVIDPAVLSSLVGKGKLVKIGTEYQYVLDGVIDGVLYNFAVSARDLKDQEIDNVVQKYNVVKGSSLDDLAPGRASIRHETTSSGITFNVRMPDINIDGSPILETSLYLEIYYAKTNPLQGKKVRKLFSDKNAVIELPLENAGDYQYAIVVRDEMDNPVDLEEHAILYFALDITL